MAKKTSIFFCAMFLTSSVVGMDLVMNVAKKLKDVKSKTILSDFHVKAGTALVAATTAVVLFKGEDLLNMTVPIVRALWEDLSNREDLLALGGVGACSVIGHYCLNRCTLEESLRLLEDKRIAFLEHEILKKQAKIQPILTTKDENEQKAKLQNVLIKLNGKHADKKDVAAVTIHEATELENSVGAVCKQIEDIIGTTKNGQGQQKEPSTLNKPQIDIEKDNKQGEQEKHSKFKALLEMLKGYGKFLRKFRSAIVKHFPPNLGTKAETDSIKLKQDQVTWTTKFGAFVPIFVQPMAMLFAALLPFFCLKFGIIVQ